jgi:hypothetical protein
MFATLARSVVALSVDRLASFFQSGAEPAGERAQVLDVQVGQRMRS